MTDLTRLRMEQEKLKLNQKYASHSDPFHTEPEESASYWSFLKLARFFLSSCCCLSCPFLKQQAPGMQKRSSPSFSTSTRETLIHKKLSMKSKKISINPQTAASSFMWKRLSADYLFFGFGTGSSSKEALRKRQSSSRSSSSSMRK